MSLVFGEFSIFVFRGSPLHTQQTQHTTTQTYIKPMNFGAARPVAPPAHDDPWTPAEFADLISSRPVVRDVRRPRAAQQFAVNADDSSKTSNSIDDVPQLVPRPTTVANSNNSNNNNNTTNARVDASNVVEPLEREGESKDSIKRLRLILVES